MEPEAFPRVTLATLEHIGVPHSPPPPFVPYVWSLLLLPFSLHQHLLPSQTFLATLNPSLTKDFDRKMSLCLFWDLLAAKFSPDTPCTCG